MHSTTADWFEPQEIAPLRRLQLPCGDQVLVTKALVKDSWLIWTDALPDEEHLWDQLTGDAVESILTLAKALHAMHRNVRNYKLCEESPFTVSRWWDPTADDDYDSGRFALLKFAGLNAKELAAMIPRSSQLVLSPVSPRAPDWVEAWVQQIPLAVRP